ncbi:MAG TPA: alpha/beta hydrolase [Polyangia bacterium]|nr:alpha/beta hydrolase [Polyangia bacterium]
MQRNHVQVLGEGRETLVLAHGFGTDQTYWREQVAAFSSRYRLVLFDHVGAGRSELSAYSPHRYRSLHGYAVDVLEVLAELEVQQCTFVGHSMSAMVGILAALDQPARFRRLVLLAGSARYLNDVGYVGGLEQADLDQLYALMAANYQAWASGFAPLAMENPERPELAAYFAGTLSAIRPDIALAVARVLYQIDLRAELPRLTLPALVLQTQHDIAVPRQAGEYLAQHLPQARFEIINARGHFPHVAAPDAVNRAILGFMS